MLFYYCLSSSQKPVPGKMFLTIQQQVFRISLEENISNSARATMYAVGLFVAYIVLRGLRTLSYNHP